MLSISKYVDIRKREECLLLLVIAMYTHEVSKVLMDSGCVEVHQASDKLRERISAGPV
jgi:hypothetical protein